MGLYPERLIIGRILLLTFWGRLISGIIYLFIYLFIFWGKLIIGILPSAYLDLSRRNPSRKALVKLRISSHKLRIETGRYDKIPREERLCNLCNSNKIEDETHFLLDCPRYSSIRDMFFSKIESKIPFLRLLSHETLISHLMNSSDYYLNIQLISFISSCFELRDKLVL